MAKPKQDPSEEIHFRLDELVRKVGEHDRIADSIPALVTGGVSVLQTAMDAKLDKLIAAQAEDAETDKALVKEIRELCADIKTLVQALCTPTTRTATLELPSGPARMTVRETRQ